MTCLAWQPEEETKFERLFRKTKKDGEDYRAWIDRIFHTYTEDQIQYLIDQQTKD